MIQTSSLLSHYSWQSNEFEYFFVTDTGNRISVIFFDCTEQVFPQLGNIHIYSLSIENQRKSSKQRMNDSGDKTRNTLLLILEEFFQKNDRTLLFVVLDSIDGKERARNRLFFGLWYKKFGYSTCDMEALPMVNVDGMKIISYLLLPKNFQEKDIIMKKMIEYVAETFSS